MQRDITRWCRECIPCQVSKTTRHTIPVLQEIPVPHRRFTEVTLDLVGPLPPSQGFRYLLTMINRSTRWFECLKLKDITASSVISGFLRAWVSRYGVPVTVVTDQGGQFTGSLWATLCTKLSIHHGVTSSFHPEANGLIERMHRRLKPSLRAKCQSSSWSTELPLILLGIRSAPRETDAISSFERVLGVPPILPGDY